MNPVVYLVAAVLVAVILWFVTRNSSGAVEKPPESENERTGSTSDSRPSGVRRRGNIRAGIQRHARDARHRDAELNSEDEDSQTTNDSKIGVKKMRKLQEKEEKRKQREQDVRDREERKKELAEKDEKRKLEEEKKRQEEEKISEEKRKEQEEKDRKEHEEYLQLKAMFSVDEEGQQAADSESQTHNMLMEFVEYIKMKKVVLLEDLASHFGLRTQDTIDRVQNMLEDEILSGVIDDRGKFIYISNEELAAVAKFVNQRGRVSISDLAQASNSLINLISESATGKA